METRKTLEKLGLNINILKCNSAKYKSEVDNIHKFISNHQSDNAFKTITKDQAKTFIENYDALSLITPQSIAPFGERPFQVNGVNIHTLFLAAMEFNTIRADADNDTMKLIQKLCKKHKLDQPINHGTFAQQQSIKALKSLCNNYLKHLEKKDFSKNLNNGISPVTEREAKYRKVTELLCILNNQKVDIPTRLAHFNREFGIKKEEISKHRDPLWLRFISNVAVILSSTALGAGLIYTYNERGTFNFFSARGKLFSDAIDKTIVDSNRNEPYKF